MAEARAPADPLLDIRVRWRAGRVLLGLAVALTAVALLRPLHAGAPPALQGGYALALGFLLVAAPLLAALGGKRRPEMLAVQAGLVLAADAFGQLVAPFGVPAWPLLVVLIAVQAVCESRGAAFGLAAQATLLAAAAAAWQTPFEPRPLAAVAAGYLGVAFAVDRALARQKDRLSAVRTELARLKHGIDLLDEQPLPAVASSEELRHVTGGRRRTLQADRASELDQALQRVVDLAAAAVPAHAVAFFDLDRQQEQARLRVGSGPEALLADCSVPINTDPFSFLLQRDQPFYATDFARLLWSLPWYRGQVKVGSLLAVPVRLAGTTIGAVVADRLEIQAFTGSEPQLLAGFAELAGEAIRSARAALGREELEAEFKAVYPISHRLAALSREKDLAEELLKLSRQISGVEGAAVVVKDEHDTRYTVFAGNGWPADYVDREVGLDQRTWTAWVLRSAEEACLLDDLSGQKDAMPVLVLDEAARPGSLLAVPLRARDRNLAALVLTAPAHTFDVSTRRVLELLANQAGATLCLIQEREMQRRIAAHDGLTGLYNRRAFNELLSTAIANEDRRETGRLGLVILDIDHFKKLNDTYGHPAGDAALRSLARLLGQHLRKGDLAARYGGEEFAVILPASDEARAAQAAERLRSALHKHRFVHGGSRIALSASFGVAIWPADGREAEALVAAADRALYEAKQGGRNRVALATPLESKGAPPPSSDRES